ncbi:conserved membrane protein of unknown function [Ruminococcaceae bacterium BL-6]|nr:conserved membrane protein of unknown function [Ruminococcaceae bacterium BL-6]
MTLMDVAHDFAVVSILLIIGYFLRMKVKLFQNFFIPASIIGGLVGLLCGPQVLGAKTGISFTYSNSIDQWPGVMLAVTFACSFLGESMGKMTRQALAATFVGGVAHQTQAVLGMAIAFLFQATIPLGFGLIPLFSLYGGIGWSVPVATIYKENNYWIDAIPVAVTIATIGVVCGIVFGMVIINIGVRKGLVGNTYASINNLPEDVRTGYVRLDSREPIGYGVARTSSIDPFGLQLAIVGVVLACAILLRNFLISIDPFWNNLPLLSTSLICSGVLGFLIGKTPLAEHIDRQTIERISGVSLEFMITAAVATTSLEAFATYLIPILVISAVTIVGTTLVTFLFSKRWCRIDWFPSAVAQYGAYMGLLSTGLLLAKVVDPDHKTVAAETVAASCTLGYSYSLPYLLLMPMLVMANPKVVMIISAVLLVAFLIVGELIFRRKTVSPELNSETMEEESLSKV